MSQERRSLWYDIYLFVLDHWSVSTGNYETMDMYQWATYMLTTLWGKAEMLTFCYKIEC